MLKEAPDPNKKEEFAIGNNSLDDLMYNEGNLIIILIIIINIIIINNLETKRYALAFDG